MGNSILSKILAFFMSIFVAIGNLFGIDVQKPDEEHVHSYDIIEITREPTCTEIGIQTFSCVCGDKIEEYIDVLGHDIRLIDEKASTCTENGLTAGVYCVVCNEVLVAQEIIPALGHTSVIDNAVEATCTENGRTEGAHCSVCNTVLKAQETIPALAHVSVVDDAVEPTCTKSGLSEGAHCSVCNTVLVAQEKVPASGHLQSTLDASTVIAASCTEKGYTGDYKCDVCGFVTAKGMFVSVTGHTSVTDKGTAATCIESGKTDGAHCSVCNTVLKAQETIPALGHKSVTDKAVAATCTESGKTEGAHCSVCGTVLKAQTTVPATGHKKSTLDTSTVIAESCTNDGYTGDYKCDACGVVTKTGDVIPKVEGKHYYEKETVPASCVADEYTIWKCIYCAALDNTRIEESGKYPNGVGHTFGAKETVAPTCQEDGYDKQVCSVCTYEERTNPVAVTGHNYKKNNKESVTATCLVSGKRVSECTVCHNVKTEELGFAPCTPVTETVAGASYANGDSCKTVLKCSVCSKVIAETENYGSHKRMMAAGPATAADCENAGVQTLRCNDCGYEYVAVVADALGHLNENDISLPDCENPGYIISSGVCMRDGCGKDMGEGTRIDLPAKGHRESGVQSCTTDVTCLECGKVTQPHFGHNFEINSTAIATGSKTVSTFFCTRCGEVCEDKVATFNAVTGRIKDGFFDSYDYVNGYPKLHRFIKSSAENTPSNINFGTYTSIVRDMFMEEMENTPVAYDRITKMSVVGALPIYGEDYVSTLESKDVDSIAVERVSGLEFGKVLSGFDDKFTYNKTEYDLTPYKAMKVNGNVIKVTIDVKTEKYYGVIDRLPAAEQTSLQKIFGIDVREQLFSERDCNKNCPENCAEHHYVKGGDGKLYMETNQDGMGNKMILNDMSTDGKVTYYFLEETYEPIIAVYEEVESMDQHMDMEISVGLTIKGSMDTLSKNESVTVYVFPGFLPA